MTDLATKHGAGKASDDAPNQDAVEDLTDDPSVEAARVEVGEDAEAEVSAPEDTDPQNTEPEDSAPEDTDPEGTDPENTDLEGTDPADTSLEDASGEDAQPGDAVAEDTAVVDQAPAVEAPSSLQETDAVPAAAGTPETAGAATATAVLAPPASAQVDAGEPGTTAYAWAPAEPAPKKRRTGLWIGLAAGAAVIGLVAASLVLIAPGTSVGGVAVGGLTQGAATDILAERLAQTTIVLTGAGDDVELSAADLGATIDAPALADAAFAEHPMWNVTQWYSEPIDAIVHLDHETATSALRAAAPSLYTDPVDATLEFDAATVSYVTTPGELGTGIDVDAVRQALQGAFEAGQSRVDFAPVQADVQPETPAFVAESTADGLNTVLDGAGFYIGAERVVPVPREVAASWITVEPGDRGTFDVSVDEGAIQPVVDTIAAAVNVAPVNNAVITNSAGAVLREESNGTVGRAVEDTSEIAEEYAAQLADFDPVFQLPMAEVPFTTVTLARRVEINLSSQRAFFYENDQLVNQLTISSGVSSSPTPKGRFTVNGYSRVQSMGCFEGAPYCVRDVPYVTWFAPDIGFHGASALRNRLGFPQSHGCVNVWDSDAKWVYDWTARGTEVWVHS